MSAEAFRVTYRVHTDERQADKPAALLRRYAPNRNEDGTFTMDVNLRWARQRGFEDTDAARRIIAIVHCAVHLDPEQIEIVSATPTR